MKKATLCFLIDNKERRILLAMKKRGFGEGKWNGPGGKLEGEETHEQAITREVGEEINVRVREHSLKRVADLTFYFDNKSHWNFHCIAFVAHAWEGEPEETDEMRPEWYTFDTIPFQEMWIDDRHWLPLVLEGKNVIAEFHFNESGDDILQQNIEIIPSF